MKSNELLPTNENLIKAFDGDLVGRNKSLYDFVTLLNSIEYDCSIALEGYWGSGKTFFVKQTQMLLNALNPFTDLEDDERERFMNYPHSVQDGSWGFSFDGLRNQVPIYYDAWINDNDSDPVLSLVLSILSEFESEFDFKDVQFNSDAPRQLLNSLISVGSLGNIKLQIPQILKSENWLSEINHNKNIHTEVTAFLDSLLAERGDRLVIFIDELDRCSPTYAVKLLERIKHYFDNDRITFVFSINTEQLQYTIKKHYGEGFNASRYLDRFFNLRLSLPPVNMSRYYKSINYYASSDWSGLINEAVIKTFRFELREIARYLNTVKMAASKSINKFNRGVRLDSDGGTIATVIFIPVLVALRIYDAKAYREFINGNNPKPLLNVFNNCADAQSILEWFLNKNESFEPLSINDTEYSAVSVNEVLMRLYNLIIKEEYTPRYSRELIGSVVIHRSTKEYLLKQISLISNLTELEVD